MSDLEQFVVANEYIRRVSINGSEYFSIIDIFYYYFPPNSNPRMRWKTAQENIIKQNYDIKPEILFYKFLGQGQRETPVITIETWRKIVSILGVSHFSQNKRCNVEIDDLHPLICKYLTERRWRFEHHYKLPSGKIMDIVAWNGSQTQIIECKINLVDDQKLFAAMGQVLCYCGEFKMNSQPCLATYEGKIRPYGLERCYEMGIQIIEITPLQSCSH